ncbi:MAG: hypothetical protein R2712_29400 [Vicinamibacterales bacterium]
MAVKFGIDYLWGGGTGAEAASAAARTKTRGEHGAVFGLAYRNTGIAIYRVVKDGH